MGGTALGLQKLGMNEPVDVAGCLPFPSPSNGHLCFPFTQ